jgi:hypothetical protein
MMWSLAQRVDTLFRALHSSDEGEPSLQLVAEAIRDCGLEVTADELADIRAGATTTRTDVLAALARYFNQPAWYLTDPGDTQRVRDAHSQLELLATLRDAGVHRVRLRGPDPSTSDREALTRSLRAHGDGHRS